MIALFSLARYALHAVLKQDKIINRIMKGWVLVRIPRWFHFHCHVSIN